ncbi:MAG TPA: SPFH domain-containing protein [Candidatus Micrarchaeaceae archaeon]|nr:SPFH domain-containing protein [Candidatus Micrarchaeaceae archaeon]
MGLLIALIVIVVLALGLSRSTVRVVQQGQKGVVKRLGRFHVTHNPGLVFMLPILDSMIRVDMREVPRRGDKQDVITKDNVAVGVSATIFHQVIDVNKALFEVQDYQVAIDQISRTALRAVFGTMSLDEALSERQRINADLAAHIADATEKWGVRVNRIEVLDIIPPTNILRAMEEQKEADQHKRSVILQSEGDKQAAINQAEGEAQANITRATAQRQATVLAAEGRKQAQILEAEGNQEAQKLDALGEASAIGAVFEAIHQGKATPDVLAFWQLKNLATLADSPNSKLVVPADFAGLMGAAKALVMATESDNGSVAAVVPSASRPSPDPVTPAAPARPLPNGGRRAPKR